ncbi:MerR family transcriptional regulator [Motilimonas eburnea]|uniref:MerR family transcriptional regulator n=1 Tax=Motilimonas eburnea TaxID=1737488 RepID=UPI001E44D22C|nr:MerR family transcriptional regulator [Motilimonas eburnea]MCE2573138.1 MerR family transcriptional regulator [Motilimonas eburnea]
MSTDQVLYPIREVSQQTGVNAVTLRAWQRRFGLLNPQRTAKGHRLYSEQDVARVHEIVSWLEKGVPISQVKPLLGQPVVQAEPSNWQQQVDELLGESVALDATKLHQRLDQLTSLYPFSLIAEKVLLPWLKQCQLVCQQRADGDLIQAWLEQQVKLRFYTRWQLANQANQGEAIWLICVGPRVWWQPLLQVNEWALAGYKVTLLMLKELAQLNLALTRMPPANLLFDLPAQVTTQQKQLFMQFSNQSYLVGEFAALHQMNLGLPVADSRQHKENWQ